MLTKEQLNAEANQLLILYETTKMACKGVLARVNSSLSPNELAKIKEEFLKIKEKFTSTLDRIGVVSLVSGKVIVAPGNMLFDLEPTMTSLKALEQVMGEYSTILNGKNYYLANGRINFIDTQFALKMKEENEDVDFKGLYQAFLASQPDSTVYATLLTNALAQYNADLNVNTLFDTLTAIQARYTVPPSLSPENVQILKKAQHALSLLTFNGENPQRISEEVLQLCMNLDLFRGVIAKAHPDAIKRLNSIPDFFASAAVNNDRLRQLIQDYIFELEGESKKNDFLMAVMKVGLHVDPAVDAETKMRGLLDVSMTGRLDTINQFLVEIKSNGSDKWFMHSPELEDKLIQYVINGDMQARKGFDIAVIQQALRTPGYYNYAEEKARDIDTQIYERFQEATELFSLIASKGKNDPEVLALVSKYVVGDKRDFMKFTVNVLLHNPNMFPWAEKIISGNSELSEMKPRFKEMNDFRLTHFQNQVASFASAGEGQNEAGKGQSLFFNPSDPRHQNLMSTIANYVTENAVMESLNPTLHALIIANNEDELRLALNPQFQDVTIQKIKEAAFLGKSDDEKSALKKPLEIIEQLLEDFNYLRNAREKLAPESNEHIKLEKLITDMSDSMFQVLHQPSTVFKFARECHAQCVTALEAITKKQVESEKENAAPEATDKWILTTSITRAVSRMISFLDQCIEVLKYKVGSKNTKNVTLNMKERLGEMTIKQDGEPDPSHIDMPGER